MIAATVLGASTGTIVLAIAVAVVLGVAWLVALFALVLDTISVGAKIAWFLALVLLAPFAIPVYLVLRHRRRQQLHGSGASEPGPA
jgi:H+/Cl- antiporter ClcA